MQPSSSPSPAQRSAQLAWLSTWYAAMAYGIFTLVAAIRTITLEQRAQAGTSNVSITPSIVITLNLLLGFIAASNRLPAIAQRIREAQTPVIL